MKKYSLKSNITKLPSTSKKPLQQKNEKRNAYMPSEGVPKFDLSGNAIERHRCNECGDTFIFKSSLEDHLNRESICITFNCSLCNKVITVYNNCSFSSHSTFHSKKCEISNVSISSLNLVESIEDVSSEAEKLVKNSDESISKLTVEGPSTSLVVKEKGSKNKRQTKKVEKNVERINAEGKKCFECGLIVGGVKQLQDHYSNIGVILQCDTCTLSCPNSCSLEAHKRLHSASKPHVCPECGEEFSEVQSLTVHTIMRCQHLFRKIVYSCPFCFSTIKSLSVVTEHISNCHTVVSLQCSVCLFKFDSESSFETHKKLVHTNEDAKLVKLFKCEQCSTEISLRSFYYTHIENHMKSLHNLTRFQFSCPQCDDRLCASKNQLLVHLKAAHLLDLKNSLKYKENLMNMMTKDLCQRYKICFESKHTESAIQVERQCTEVDDHSFLCETCGKKTKSREEMFSHGKSQHMSKGVYVCLICSNKGMGSEEVLLNHLNTVHSKESKCPLNMCSNLKFGAYTVLDHFIEKHGLINRLDSKDDDVLNCRNEEQPVKKQKMCNVKPYNNGYSNSKNCRNGFSKNFNCSVCDYMFTEEEDFKLHMSIHKNDKAPFLCFECGSCFVAAPSFKRHLQSEHKIENGNDYIAKYLPELYETVSEDNVDVISLIQDESLTGSICPVCKATYANSTDLKTHVRVHGMAFIKSCQKSNSLHFLSF